MAQPASAQVERWLEFTTAAIQSRLSYHHETPTKNRYGFSNGRGVVHKWQEIEGGDFVGLYLFVLLKVQDLRKAALEAHGQKDREYSGFLITHAMFLMTTMKDFLPSEEVLTRRLLISLRDEEELINVTANRICGHAS